MSSISLSLLDFLDELRRRFGRVLFKHRTKMLIVCKSGGIGDLVDPVAAGIQESYRLLHPVFVQEVQKCLPGNKLSRTF